MNRKEAVALCLKTYVPDKPCKRGHSLRYTTSMSCAICCKPEKSAEKKLRLEAIDNGLKVYNTGKPCKNGHLADRYVKTRTCKECNKNAATRHREPRFDPSLFKRRNSKPFRSSEILHNLALPTWTHC